jgi:small redox-active disulfide protein 2
MKKIKVLGTGCPKCKTLAAVAEQAAKDAGVEYTLEKVTNINDISAFGVMFTPALVIDGEVKLSGRVPSADEVKKLLA